MVLLIMIPFLNGYFIGNINPTFSDKPKRPKMERNEARSYDLKADTQHLKRKISLNDDTPTWVSLFLGGAFSIPGDRWRLNLTFPTMPWNLC